MSDDRKLREWMEHWLKTQEQEFLETLKTRPVIFANLTPEEYGRFEKAHIETTGSSGKGGRPGDYKGLAPFIASYFYEIPKALHTLGWNHPHVSEHDGQMVIKHELEQPVYVVDIGADKPHFVFCDADTLGAERVYQRD